MDAVTHSMGGLILRYAMAQVERDHPSFPPYLRIEDVVTLGTPHGGARFTSFVCWTTQCDQMRAGSGFLNWLQSYAWEPDTAVNTDWSTYGSDSDQWVAADRAAGTDSDRSPAHKYIGSCHKTWYKDISGIRHDDFKTLTSSADSANGYRFDCNGAGWTRDTLMQWPVRRTARALTLAPLCLGELIPTALRSRLVEEHLLLHPRRYAAPVGIPSVAMDEPAFRPGFDRWRAWRGPSWMNTAWLLVPHIAAAGHEAAAARIADRLTTPVLHEGLREYYDPRHGRGLGSRGFGWSALVVDLLLPG